MAFSKHLLTKGAFDFLFPSDNSSSSSESDDILTESSDSEDEFELLSSLLCGDVAESKSLYAKYLETVIDNDLTVSSFVLQHIYK